jgi:hypothetical protein
LSDTLDRLPWNDLYSRQRIIMRRPISSSCLALAGFLALTAAITVPMETTAATTPAPGEYAVVTTGCTQFSDAFGAAIVVTIYNAPDGNLVAHETVSGPFIEYQAPPGNQQFTATQFHSGQPVPLGIVQFAIPNESYSVSYSWTDGKGVAHTLSPTPTIIATPAACQSEYLPQGPFPQLSYVSMLPDAAGDTYQVLSNTGLLLNFGPNDESTQGSPPDSNNDLSDTELNAPIVGMARGPTDAASGDTLGYWIVTADGGVFSFGGFTPFYGSAGGLHLNKPIVGMASTSTADGYWLVASDGGVFAYGGAQFYGSTGSMHLNSPIVGIAPTPDNLGYYLVAADGGVFTFGDARFQGSMGAVHLNQPVIGMAVDPATGGYWLAAADGGIFSFNAPFLGSTGNIHLNQPIVSFAATPTGNGYWFMGADGGIFNYGDARFYGSAVG